MEKRQYILPKTSVCIVNIDDILAAMSTTEEGFDSGDKGHAREYDVDWENEE